LHSALPSNFAPHRVAAFAIEHFAGAERPIAFALATSPERSTAAWSEERDLNAAGKSEGEGLQWGLLAQANANPL
jgi:hypothetical protein